MKIKALILLLFIFLANSIDAMDWTRFYEKTRREMEVDEATEALKKLLKDAESKNYWTFLEEDQVSRLKKEYRSYISNLLKQVKELLHKGADPNAQMKVYIGTRSSPAYSEPLYAKGSFLSEAIILGYPELIKLLLESGANPNDNKGFHPVAAAILSIFRHDVIYLEGRNKLVFEYLLSAGADPTEGLKEILSTRRLDERGSISMMYGYGIYLVKAGANINTKDPEDGQTLLHVVSFPFASYEPIISLLNYGADPNVKDYRGKTPFDLYLCNKRYNLSTSIVKEFIKANAHANEAAVQCVKDKLDSTKHYINEEIQKEYSEILEILKTPEKAWEAPLEKIK